jgi:hypothetical protein
LYKLRPNALAFLQAMRAKYRLVAYSNLHRSMLKVIIDRLEELLQGPFKRILFHHVWSESDYVRVPNYGEVFENFYNLGIDNPKENTIVVAAH